MLNIPGIIINLYKTDSVRKNFRVRFPNGENADLTNSDIVANSVSFTESVCSKDVLQFGLAEASRIQFECVNVQNIYGMTIECGIEIDTSSLTPGEITSIQGNEGDGTLVLESASDIGYGYYRIPYGVFTVSSCPRSSGAMWRRRVEAYNDSYFEISTFLKNKLSMANYHPSIVQNIPCLLAGERNDISDLNVTSSSIDISGGSYSTGNDSVWWAYNGNNYEITFDSNYNYVYTPLPGAVDDKDALFRVTCDIDLTQIKPIYEKAQDYGIPNNVLSALHGMLEPSFAIDSYTGWNLPFDNPADSGYVYPFYDTRTFGIYYPLSFGSSHLVIKKDGLTVDSFTLTPYITNAQATKYDLVDTLDKNLNIFISNTSQNNTIYGYIESFSMRSLMEGYAELQGMFYKNNRSAGYEYITLSKSSPVSMSTDDYSSLWWDEYDISPIGSVQLTYKDIDLNAEQTILYEFGDGLSMYDMTNNYLLKNLAVSASDLNGQTVEEFVTSLLDTYFIPNVQDIAFTPVQLESLGLPYLEAGDYIEIDDGNGGTVGTYIMSRTLSGEQFLTDDIESKGGEIIGNARSA